MAPAARLGVRAALVGGALVPGDVAVAGGRIAAVGLAPGMRDRLAAPGFVDLQVNGAGGVDLLGAGTAGWSRAGAALRATGTTAFQPTFITAPEAVVAAALAGMPRGRCGPDGPRVLGAHLEGPFLSPARLGVHDPAVRRDPDAALLARLLDAGPVAQVTLAPELPGALDLVSTLLARGVTVAAGHTDATAAQAHAAFDRGLRTVTHLHNAMRPMRPRDPGVAGAALARPDVTVQVIADGRHLAPETLLVCARAAAGRMALATDATAATGMPDGPYALAGRVLHAAGGTVRDAEGRLAGGALPMDAAVRLLHGLGVPLEEVLAAASTVPARIAGRADLGSLAPGAPADVVVLDDRLEVAGVLVGGAG